MLTRRGFAGIASCASLWNYGVYCHRSVGPRYPPAATGGVTRKILSRQTVRRRAM